MAKKSKKDDDGAKKQAKKVKKLEESVEELREQNEKLAGSVKKLRKDQEETREEISAFRDSRANESDTAATGTPTVSADDEIETGEEVRPDDSSAPPTVSADGEIESSKEPRVDAGPESTEGAKQKARDLGVNLPKIKGTGAEGRITVKDVEKAARGS